MNILITGGAGYVGSMLIDRLAKDDRIATIMVVDLLGQPDRITSTDKLVWIQADLATNDWQAKVLAHAPIDAVVHAAFKIRNPIGKVEQIERNNIDASNNVFAFCFDNAIGKLIYLSSVAAYGAKVGNIGMLIPESAPLQEQRAPYGYQKKVVEEALHKLIKTKKPATESVVLRLNSITGPLGQSLKSKFGLITFLKEIMPFIIEGNAAWARQFVHEDDLIEIIERLVFKPAQQGMHLTYNVAPESFLTARDMAHALGKKVISIHPAILKPLFAIAWYVSLGKVPTRPDSVAGLIYPINVDGTAIKEIGFTYRYSAKDALLAQEGRYFGAHKNI